MADTANESPDRYGIDPLEMVSDAVNKARELIMYSDPMEGRRYFRRALERALAHMCPICGRTDDHESADGEVHRFVAPRQRFLDSVSLRG